MDIERELSHPQSRAWAVAIAEYVGDDPGRFAELVRALERGDFRTKQRAAYPLTIAAECHPRLAIPHLSKLVEFLPRKDVHNAVKRGVTRTLQFVDVPGRLQGKVFSYCIDLVADPSEPIAVRCFALTAAQRVAAGRRELMNELRIVATNSMEQASAGLRGRISRLLEER